MADAGGLEFGAPFPFGNNSGDWGYTEFAIDDAGSDKAAAVFQAPAAMTITHIGMRVGAYTGSARNYDFRLESVTATTGLPSGTPLGSVTGVSLSSTDVNTFKWATLGTPYACTRGQLLAIVVQGSAATSPDVSNFATISYALDNLLESPASRHGFPIALTDVAAAGFTKHTQQAPLYAIKDANQAHGYPIETLTLRGITTNGHRFAAKFTIPSTWFSTFQIRGIRFPGRWTAASTMRIGLWNAAGTALQQVDLDTDIAASTGVNYGQSTVYFDEATLSTLSTGTTYYIGIERVENSVPLYSVDCNAATPDLTAFAGGNNFNLSYWDTSSWSETGYEKSRPILQIILEDITGGGSTRTGLVVFGG